MRVSSPIGDLPFEPRSIRFERGGVRVEGVMGAWPAIVLVEADDLPGLARLLAKPLMVAALIATTIVGSVRMVRPSRRNTQRKGTTR